ncbi:hypothetical protein OIU76_029587 [Salix suchowensis]|nr:hypothetical protein OIU76_029587 [Salix suchowensis]
MVESKNSSKDIESELAKLSKNMDIQGRNDSMKHLGGDSFRKSKQLGGSPALKSMTEEFHTAKKEMASIREEGFQFMS